jgi:predicted peroxiredoxin
MHHKEILGLGTKLRQSGSQVTNNGIEMLVCDVQASVRRLDIRLVSVGFKFERFSSVFIINMTLIILG